MTDRNGLDDPRFHAAIDMIGRTGATGFQIRYSGRDEDDTTEDPNEPTPIVWIAVADYRQGNEAAAAMHPLTAVLRLAEQLVDGSTCVHCKRPAGIDDHWDRPQPMPETFCWYVFDPETRSYRRSCEGEAKVNRNDPCPCGSGEKFKRCHGAPSGGA